MQRAGARHHEVPGALAVSGAGERERVSPGGTPVGDEGARAGDLLLVAEVRRAHEVEVLIEPRVLLGDDALGQGLVGQQGEEQRAPHRARSEARLERGVRYREGVLEEPLDVRLLGLQRRVGAQAEPDQRERGEHSTDDERAAHRRRRRNELLHGSPPVTR